MATGDGTGTPITGSGGSTADVRALFVVMTGRYDLIDDADDLHC